MVGSMPANWYIPSSATATLVVGLARGEIFRFSVPPAAEEGDIIGSTVNPLGIGVRNVGTLAGAISLRIRDLDGATIWTGSITLPVGETGWVYPAPAYPMPARDLRLRVEAYHDTVVDSYLDVTILLIVRVDTAMTLVLEPAAVEPGATYHYVGALTRVDTGEGLAGMEIIARREGVEVARGTTGTDGNYDIASTAPSETGSFICEAAFPGVVPFAASSARVNLGVGVVLAPLIWAIASAAVGVGLLIAGSG